MSRHAFSHRRHSSAHFFIVGSEARFSHSSPHRLQASAHALQMVSEKGPLRAVMHAADAHTDAQSWQVRSVVRWSFFPSATSVAQWAEQASHAIAQAPQALAQSIMAAL